jgi:hypothetical protein
MINFMVLSNAYYPPTLMSQPLADPTDLRTNNMLELYFVTRNNQQWNSIGYRLSGPDYQNGIGTLYRFSTNSIAYADTAALTGLPNYFLTSDPTKDAGWSRIIDGVVDFRVKVYNMNGALLTQTNSFNGQLIIQTNGNTGEYIWEQFEGDALPAYVEVEMGVLEDRALARYKALSVGGTGPNSVGWGYLTNHAGQVHIFRQRVPIRDVNPSYYP